VLSAQQRAFWNDNGFLVVPGFFEEHDTEVVARALERTWNEPTGSVVVDDLVTGRRQRAVDVPEADRSHPFKVNDLYLEFEEVRRVCMSERVSAMLRELLADEPVLINTLNLEYGSQQADHVDSLYMTPRTQGGLTATWMALEDVVADAGPLRYYPGSHHIDQYRFANGEYHALDPEMPQWAEYMADSVERKGLEETRFLAKKGDLFIWHAHLLHGGSEICNPALTRNSLVSHFWTKTDTKALGHEPRPVGDAFWLERPPQPVPEDPAPAAPEPKPAKRSLWDRLRTVTARD
jgi:ectoine hydroxylase-related dioxygenase (phytanoyl-CoA dioxygenase family)